VSSSSASAQSTSTTAQDAARSQEPVGEISKRRNHDGGSASNDFYIESSIDSYESMVLHGKPYLCAIPHVEIAQKNETTIAQSKAEEEAELARATDRGWELLKEMEGNCMFYISGWWSYSFCYNTNVKQFHQLPPGQGAPIFPPIEDPATPSYVLGKFPTDMIFPPSKQVSDGSSTNSNPSEKSSITSLQAKGEVRYLVQKLSGGTTCDLTGRPRKIEIQFHCHPQSADRIAWIKEISTCSYLMVVYTPRLCNDAAFLPPRENRANPITCREVVAEPDIPDWQARRAADLAGKLVNSGTPSGRPIVGGIEVGAMNHVGKEGQRLEPPANIQSGSGGNGKVELLAKQDPKEKGGKVQRVSDEELKRMGLEPALVEGARRELAEVAGGKGWKLEVFDGVEGRELRGVVEGEDVDGEGEGEGGENGDGDGGEEEVGSEEVYKDEL